MVQDLESRIEKLKALTRVSKGQVKHSKYSHIDPELVIELLKSGLTMPQIAEIYNCSPQTVKYQVKLDYPDFDGRKYIRLGRTDITVEEVAKLYKKIGSSTKIARYFGVNTHLITNRLEKAGIKRRPLYRDVSNEEILGLYNKYKRTTIVAEKLNISRSLVYYRLRNMEVEIDSSYKNEIKRKDIPEKEVLRLYDNNFSIASISEKYNACDSTIRIILVRNKRKIRGHGESIKLMNQKRLTAMQAGNGRCPKCRKKGLYSGKVNKKQITFCIYCEYRHELAKS